MKDLQWAAMAKELMALACYVVLFAIGMVVFLLMIAFPTFGLIFFALVFAVLWLEQTEGRRY